MRNLPVFKHRPEQHRHQPQQPFDRLCQKFAAVGHAADAAQASGGVERQIDLQNRKRRRADDLGAEVGHGEEHTAVDHGLGGLAAAGDDAGKHRHEADQIHLPPGDALAHRVHQFQRRSKAHGEHAQHTDAFQRSGPVPLGRKGQRHRAQQRRAQQLHQQAHRLFKLLPGGFEQRAEHLAQRRLLELFGGYARLVQRLLHVRRQGFALGKNHGGQHQQQKKDTKDSFHCKNAISAPMMFSNSGSAHTRIRQRPASSTLPARVERPASLHTSCMF